MNFKFLIKKYSLIFLSVFFIAFKVSGKNDSLKIYEDSLLKISSNLFSGKTDAERLELNQKFISVLEKAINQKGSFNYSFDTLFTIGKIYSPDKKFRIYNWNLNKTDGTHEYFGFIQLNNKRKLLGFIPAGERSPKIFPLIDKSPEIKNAENYTGDNTKWFGMLYYSIVLKKYKGAEYYTLLGWDGNDKLSRKKIIDVLTFDKEEKPKFGEDIFTIERRFPKRVILEFSPEFSVSLKYNKESDMIIFSHLIPPTPTLTGQFQFYGPDFSFDGLKFEKGKWVYVPDVDARNMTPEKEAPKPQPKKPIYQPK